MEVSFAAEFIVCMNEMGILSYLFILNKKYIFCIPLVSCRMDKKNQGSQRGRAIDFGWK